MCGIVGYVGNREGGRPVQELLLDGLKKLEYRGYDSAGISVIGEERIETVRAVGNLDALQAKLDGLAFGADDEAAREPWRSRCVPPRPASATPAGPRMGG